MFWRYCLQWAHVWPHKVDDDKIGLCPGNVVAVPESTWYRPALAGHFQRHIRAGRLRRPGEVFLQRGDKVHLPEHVQALLLAEPSVPMARFTPASAGGHRRYAAGQLQVGGRGSSRPQPAFSCKYVHILVRHPHAAGTAAAEIVQPQRIPAARGELSPGGRRSPRPPPLSLELWV